MSSGTCQLCGNTYKNIGAHRCKGKSQEKAMKQEESFSKTPTTPAEPITPKPKQSLISKLFSSKKETIEVMTPQELIEGLPAYKIPVNNPKTGIGKITNRNKDFIQVVLVSNLTEPKMFWAEKTGLNRIKYEDRMFKLPRDIRGNVFFWHMDQKMPLVDTAEATEADGESSFHELQLANMYYSIGRAAGANDLLNNLKFILIISILCICLVAASLIYLNRIDKGITANDQQIIDTLWYINQSVHR